MHSIVCRDIQPHELIYFECRFLTSPSANQPRKYKWDLKFILYPKLCSLPQVKLEKQILQFFDS